VGAVKLIMDKFEPLVGTSSTYLMPGEEMVVTAGLGAFNSNVKPVVNIDGASIQVNANGVAEKKIQCWWYRVQEHECDCKLCRSKYW